ncbi:Rho termination factor N-terminal domain-containing protein [candidate division KSB1 bacterium]|nr:Rho termination factor N-terminal domain-containing protein [candidate division KSB1 bacterium]
MEHTYDELKKKTVAQLREIAAGIEHDVLKGYTQLNKEHLLEALCKALNLEMHHHHEVVGINKRTIKSGIKELKKKRDEAIKAQDHAELKKIRKQIHKLKRKLHKAMV